MSSRESAGILLYRQGDNELEVLLVHPSGWYNKKASWSIPKGLPELGEALEQAALRETLEETGVAVEGDLVSLQFVTYKSGEWKACSSVQSWLACGRRIRYLALILDNEVTVGEFVVTPPLLWVRLIQRGGVFQMAEGYPTVLTAQQATFEMKNWDEVSLPSIVQMLNEVGEWADYVVLGNNAGQGLAIAEGLPQDVISKRGVIIYAQALPEINAYARLGYRRFHRRNEIIPRLLEDARETSRALSLCFVNTIQHDETNDHDP